MAQYEFQVSDYERIFRKRYKLVLLTVFCAIVFSVIFSRSKTPSYSAIATVKVDRNSVMGFESTIYGSWDNIETQTRVLTSFPVLLLAAKRLHWVADSVSVDTYSGKEATLGTLQGLRGRVSVSLSGGTNIISVRSVSGKPEEARDVANALAFAYKDFSLNSKREYASKTKEFIEGQLKRCKEDLQASEQDIRAFEENQQIPSITANDQKILGTRDKIEQDIKNIDNDILIIETQKKKLADLNTAPSASPATPVAKPIDSTLAPILGMRWVSDGLSDPGIAQLNSRLMQLQIQLDDQGSFYKKNHPANKDIENKIKSTITEILDEYSKKLKTLADKKSDLLKQKQENDFAVAQIPSNEMEYARLVRKLKINEEMNALLERKLQEALISEAGVVDDVTIMSMATLPRTADNKDFTRILMIGILLGLLMGVILAIIREMLDTSIGTIEEVEGTLKLRVLAVIPHIHFEEPKTDPGKPGKEQVSSLKKPRFRAGLVTQFLPKEPCAEAYRILRTNIEYLSFDNPIKTLLVTSATMQEGKSTTIANFAITLAQQGKRILLLECNLRRPSLYRVFGLEKGPGTADIIIEKAKWQDCVKTVTDLTLGEFTIEEILHMPGLENLNIITYGHTPPNPAELLSSSKMDELISELRENFDIVLVDGPPLLPVADSMVLATKVEGVVLIYKAGQVPRSSIRLAKERLGTVQANLLGLVLNDIKPETSGASYVSAYSRYYGRDESRRITGVPVHKKKWSDYLFPKKK